MWCWSFLAAFSIELWNLHQEQDHFSLPNSLVPLVFQLVISVAVLLLQFILWQQNWLYSVVLLAVLADWVLLGDETHMANLLGRKRESTIYDWAQLFNEPSKSLCRSPKRQSDLFSPNTTPQPLRFGLAVEVAAVQCSPCSLLVCYCCCSFLLSQIYTQAWLGIFKIGLGLNPDATQNSVQCI